MRSNRPPSMAPRARPPRRSSAHIRWKRSAAVPSLRSGSAVARNRDVATVGRHALGTATGSRVSRRPGPFRRTMSPFSCSGSTGTAAAPSSCVPRYAGARRAAAVRSRSPAAGQPPAGAGLVNAAPHDRGRAVGRHTPTASPAGWRDGAVRGSLALLQQCGSAHGRSPASLSRFWSAVSQGTKPLAR